MRETDSPNIRTMAADKRALIIFSPCDSAGGEVAPYREFLIGWDVRLRAYFDCWEGGVKKRGLP